jgi:hypothetical protein
MKIFCSLGAFMLARQPFHINTPTPTFPVLTSILFSLGPLCSHKQDWSRNYICIIVTCERGMPPPSTKYCNMALQRSLLITFVNFWKSVVVVKTTGSKM